MASPQFVDPRRGRTQLPPASDTGDAAGLYQMRVVRQIADHEQRRPVGTAHQQRHRTRRVTRGGQQHQTAVTKEVVPRGDPVRPVFDVAARGSGRFHVDAAPPQSGDVDV
ncbi:hypothetical protein GCM10023317_46830 [Actinopolymorpha pittospori]